MKNLRIVALLLMLTMIATASAIAQTTDSKPADEMPASIAAARCRYTTADAACVGLNDSDQSDPGANATVAQMPRRIPGPPTRPRRPPVARPRAGYPRPWMEFGNPRHAAIGAAIGFTLGAVHPNDGTVRGHVAVGLIGALLGAALGAGVPSFHARNRYPRGPWPDEDEEASGSQPKSDSVKGNPPAQSTARGSDSSGEAPASDDPVPSVATAH